MNEIALLLPAVQTRATFAHTDMWNQGIISGIARDWLRTRDKKRGVCVAAAGATSGRTVCVRHSGGDLNILAHSALWASMARTFALSPLPRVSLAPRLFLLPAAVLHEREEEEERRTAAWRLRQARRFRLTRWRQQRRAAPAARRALMLFFGLPLVLPGLPVSASGRRVSASADAAASPGYHSVKRWDGTEKNGGGGGRKGGRRRQKRHALAYNMRHMPCGGV